MFNPKSPVKPRPKPVNVFYIWYTELCRRSNSNPVPAVKPAKPKSPTVLDFVCDRLHKVEDWTPVINALGHDTSLHVINIRSRIDHKRHFLHDIDTEDKARNLKKKGALLWTNFILNSLLKSISHSLRNTQVLSCLELDGLPVFNQYLKPLLEALKRNKSIKSLSFTNCPIQDIGCQTVCAYLRFIPNVEILNLSGCNLTAQSGLHLSKLVKFQQINRNCESWRNSLRYEDPESVSMRGIKRITLNNNPLLGDKGLEHILNELEDDLWIRAVDLQKCGLTDNLSDKIIDVVGINKSLEIFDVRFNELISLTTLDTVLQLLKEKLQNNVQSEYQWCNTTVSLTWHSVSDSKSRVSNTSSSINKLNKTNSSSKNGFVCKNNSNGELSIKKSSTNNQLANKNGLVKEENICNILNRLNSKLNLENNKEIELKYRHQYQKPSNGYYQNKNQIKTTSDKPAKRLVAVKKNAEHETQQKCYKNGLKIEMPQIVNGHNKTSTGFSKLESQTLQNGVKNIYSNNGISLVKSASNTLQKLLFSETILEDNNSNDTDLLNYFKQQKKYIGNKISHSSSSNDNNNNNGSQISLVKLMSDYKRMKDKNDFKLKS